MVFYGRKLHPTPSHAEPLAETATNNRDRYIFFNLFAAVFIYWVGRVPKKGQQAKESTADKKEDSKSEK